MCRLFARHGLTELTADGRSKPASGFAVQFAGGIIAAKFVEIGVDPGLAIVRIRRVISVIDGGPHPQRELARGQIIGGTIGAISQALFEDTMSDAGTGQVANIFGDYLIPVNADIPTWT